MTIQRPNSKSKSNKRRQYVGNIYVRRPGKSSLSTEFESSLLQSDTFSSTGESFQTLNNHTSSTQVQVPTSNHDLTLRRASSSAEDVISDGFDYDQIENELMTLRERFSQEGLLGSKRMKEAHPPVSINMVTVRSNTPRKLLKKKISMDTSRRRTTRSFDDDMSGLTSCSSMKEKEEFQIECDDDTSTF